MYKSFVIIHNLYIFVINEFSFCSVLVFVYSNKYVLSTSSKYTINIFVLDTNIMYRREKLKEVYGSTQDVSIKTWDSAIDIIT